MPKKVDFQIWEIRGNREYLWFFWKNEKGTLLVRVRCLDCWKEQIIIKKNFTRWWKCRDCKQKELTESLVKNQTKHWLAKNKWHRPLYDIYMWILGRCNNTKDKAYKNYWGRGIKCEWNNVEEFVRDMWEWYREWLTIDRIDVNWNYCKDNCRWASREEQQNNRRNNIYVEIGWVRYNSSEFAKKFWISKSIASHRICWYLHGRYSLDSITKYWKQKNRSCWKKA